MTTVWLAPPHPKIVRAEEAMLFKLEMVGMLKKLQLCLEQNSPHRLRKLTAQCVSLQIVSAGVGFVRIDQL